MEFEAEVLVVGNQRDFIRIERLETNVKKNPFQLALKIVLRILGSEKSLRHPVGDTSTASDFEPVS